MLETLRQNYTGARDCSVGDNDFSQADANADLRSNVITEGAIVIAVLPLESQRGAGRSDGRGRPDR